MPNGYSISVVPCRWGKSQILRTIFAKYAWVSWYTMFNRFANTTSSLFQFSFSDKWYRNPKLYRPACILMSVLHFAIYVYNIRCRICPSVCFVCRWNIREKRSDFKRRNLGVCAEHPMYIGPSMGTFKKNAQPKLLCFVDVKTRLPPG